MHTVMRTVRQERETPMVVESAARQLVATE